MASSSPALKRIAAGIIPQDGKLPVQPEPNRKIDFKFVLGASARLDLIWRNSAGASGADPALGLGIIFGGRFRGPSGIYGQIDLSGFAMADFGLETAYSNYSRQSYLARLGVFLTVSVGGPLPLSVNGQQADIFGFLSSGWIDVQRTLPEQRDDGRYSYEVLASRVPATVGIGLGLPTPVRNLLVSPYAAFTAEIWSPGEWTGGRWHYDEPLRFLAEYGFLTGINLLYLVGWPERKIMPRQTPPRPRGVGGIERKVERVEKRRDHLILPHPIHFKLNLAVLDLDDPGTVASLDALARELMKCSYTIQIEGHCDYRGTDLYNQDLSERRARAVMDYLIDKGVMNVQLKSVGFGKTRPLAVGSDDASHAANRRVEFRILHAPDSCEN